MSELTEFYDRLRGFLLEAGIEDNRSMSGYSEAAIAAAEVRSKGAFPEAYRLFLQHFGQKANMHNFQEYQLEYLPDALEVMQDISSRNQLADQNILPISQWQGYSLFCIRREGNNPEVVLIVEGDDGVELYTYPTFTGWVLDRIKTFLKQQAPPGIRLLQRVEMLEDLGHSLR